MKQIITSENRQYQRWALGVLYYAVHAAQRTIVESAKPYLLYILSRARENFDRVSTVQYSTSINVNLG
jgi:hypothetical protein